MQVNDRSDLMKTLPVLTLLIAAPATAQVTIDSHGVRSGGTVIDASGVHTPRTSVTATGIHGGAARAGGGGTVVNGNGATRRIDCGGGGLTINGNRNNLTVANCRSVTVAGNRNTVAVGFAGPGRLSVVGNGDQVTYTAPPRTAVAVSNVGTRSSVARR